MKKQTKILFLFLLIPIFFGSLYSVAIEYPMILQIRNDTTALINKSAENNYLLWNKTWDGASTDYGQGVALDTAGNIYCTGYTNSFGAGGWDFALVKFYPNGTRAWNTTWGGASTDYDQGVALDTAGNIYCTGYTNSFGAGAWDLALVKFYPNGTRAWNTTWGGASTDFGQGVALDTAGNIYCTGRTYSFGAGNGDLPLVKFYPNGTLAWNTIWGGASADIGQGVALDTAGNIYCTGYTNSFGVGGSDFALVKFYTNGYIAWNKTWGGASSDQSFGVALDTAGNIYCTGHTFSFGAGSDDLALVKFIIPPEALVLDPISPASDEDGIIELNWNDVVGVDKYYIYRELSNITSVAGLQPKYVVTESHYTDTLTNDNTYYYVIVAAVGSVNSTISNCESVTVSISHGIPGFELTPIIVLISILIVFILNKNVKTTKKLEFANKKNCTSGCKLPHQLITSSAN